ncbi:MAG: bacillithiol biosynthesis BshC, partial [Planctomycetes bacterium]|nr:bacillithiol biosynthesis BshC [Planctomycetota bacterium]
MLTLPRDETYNASEAGIAAAYVGDFNRVSSFFVEGWSSLEGIKARALNLRKVGAFGGIDRVALAKTLVAAMRPLGASAHSIDNAKSIASEDTFCIVTGQQACLAGGPLYVLAKVAHAIALAKALSGKGVRAVPVFWAASEDHDLDEANLFTALDAKAKLRRVRVRDLGESAHKAMEALKLPAFEDEDVQSILHLLGKGPRREEAIELLRLGLGSSFGVAINRMLLKLFADDGLIVVEPRHLRRFAGFREVIGQEIENPRSVAAALHLRREELENRGFHAPLAPSEYLNTFALISGR